MGKNNRNIIDNVEVGKAYENFMDDQNALKKKRKKTHNKCSHPIIFLRRISLRRFYFSML